MTQKLISNKYKKTSIETANRGHLLLMLYEAALVHIKKSIEAIESKNMAKKGSHIVKAHDILNELQNTLDFKVGGQIAIDLDRLYIYVTEQLVEANLSNSVQPLKTSITILENLLDGWRVAVSEVNRKTESPQKEK